MSRASACGSGKRLLSSYIARRPPVPQKRVRLDDTNTYNRLRSRVLPDSWRSVHAGAVSVCDVLSALGCWGAQLPAGSQAYQGLGLSVPAKQVMMHSLLQNFLQNFYPYFSYYSE